MNDIKPGFKTIEDILDFIKKANFSFVEEFKIIRFRNQYYAVAYQSSKKEVIIMRDFIWYMSESGEVTLLSTNDFNSNKIPYSKLKSRAKNVSPAIYNDMLNIDSEMKIYKIVKDNEDIIVKDYYTSMNIFYVIVGLYFYNQKYTLKEIKKLVPYFKNCSDFLQLFDYDITSVNPFRGLAHITINGVEYEIPYRFDYILKSNGKYGMVFSIKGA